MYSACKSVCSASYYLSTHCFYSNLFHSLYNNRESTRNKPLKYNLAFRLNGKNLNIKVLLKINCNFHDKTSILIQPQRKIFRIINEKKTVNRFLSRRKFPSGNPLKRCRLAVILSLNYIP